MPGIGREAHIQRRIRVNGRRGAFQLTLGVFYVIVGSSFFCVPATPAREALFGWLTAYVPLGVFAALWVVAGLVALVCAWLPRPRDAAGFIAMVFAPGIWSGLYAISAAVTVSPLALLQAIVYGVFAALVLIASGMQGPNDRDRREVIR